MNRLAWHGAQRAGRPDPGRLAIPRWANQHIPTEERELRYHDAAAGAYRRVPYKQPPVARRSLPRKIRIVTSQPTECAVDHLRRRGLGVVKSNRHRPRDGVVGAPADRVVEVALYYLAPGSAEHGSLASPADQCRERLSDAEQFELDRGVPPLERRPGAVHSLECPGVSGRPPELPPHHGNVRQLGFRSYEEFLEAGPAELTLRCDLHESFQQFSKVRASPMVVCPDEDRHVLRGGAREHHVGDPLPSLAESRRGTGEGGPDFVSFLSEGDM